MSGYFTLLAREIIWQNTELFADSISVLLCGFLFLRISANYKAVGEAGCRDYLCAMSTAATTDAPTETDIRAKILQPISAAHSLSRLLGGSTAWHCSSRQDLLVGVRELRRAIRFSDELNVAFFCRSSGGGNGWTLRVYSVTSERFADLVCCRGGIRRWQRLDSAVRFLKTNCPTVKDFTVRLLD